MDTMVCHSEPKRMPFSSLEVKESRFPSSNLLDLQKRDPSVNLGLSQKVGLYRLEITKMSSFMFSLSSLRCRGDWRRALARVALTTNFQ